MRTRIFALALPVLVLGIANMAIAQGMPASQPSILTIVREEVKAGRGSEHAKHEAGWPAAYEKANSPYYYLALVSMTGPSEAWYVSSYNSHAAMADSMKMEDKDPALSSELARLSRVDAEYINGVRVIQTSARTDLSQGDFPDLAKARFDQITIFRVRPGHESQFEEAAKAYGAAAKRASVNARYRVYEVVAGMPAPAYIIFSTVDDYAEFDQRMTAGQATMKALTADERATMQKFAAEALVNEETNRFRVDPLQSYVSEETRAKDPAFWSPK